MNATESKPTQIGGQQTHGWNYSGGTIIDYQGPSAGRVKYASGLWEVVECGETRYGYPNERTTRYAVLKRILRSRTGPVMPYGPCPTCNGAAAYTEYREDGNERTIHTHAYPNDGCVGEWH